MSTYRAIRRHHDDYYLYLTLAVCDSCERYPMSLKRTLSADPEKRSGAEDNSIRTGRDDDDDGKLLRKVDLRWVCAYNELWAVVILMFAQSSAHPHFALLVKFLGPVRASPSLGAALASLMMSFSSSNIGNAK